MADKFVIFLGVLTLTVASVSSLRTFQMQDYCGFELNTILSSYYQGRLKLDVQDSYDTATAFGRRSRSCEVKIKPRHSYDRILFYFDDLDLPCDIGYLTFYEGTSTPIDGLGTVCGTDKPEKTYVTYGQSMTIKYKAIKPNTWWNAMDLVFSAFHDGPCESYEYKCSNNRCISNDLNCNGHNPCGDESDCRLRGGVIAGIVIGSLVGVGIIVSIIVAVVCCRRRRSAHRGAVMQPYTLTTHTTTQQYAPPPYSTATPPTGQQWTPAGYPLHQYPGQQAPGVFVSATGGTAEYNSGGIANTTTK